MVTNYHIVKTILKSIMLIQTIMNYYGYYIREVLSVILGKHDGLLSIKMK